MKFKARKSLLPLALLAMAIALAACAPSRYVRPLEKDELAISGSLGGPLFENFGAPIPVPFATVSAGYGIGERLTGFAGLNLTSLAFANVQLDLGVNRLLLEAQGARPGISIAPAANLVVGLREGDIRLWPSLDANAFWEYGERKSHVYAGLGAWFVLAGTRSGGADQPQNVLPNFQLGHVLAGKKWDFQVELKWSNLAANNEDGTVDWTGIGGQGAVGVFFGISKRLGK